MPPNDHGPIYAETLMGRFPVEPWNTYSNALFLLLVLYLGWRTRLNFRRYPLVVIGIPILFAGFIGGTIYHATRSSDLWLRMDYLPIFILSTFASFYFLKVLLRGIFPALISVVALALIIRAPWFFGELPIGIKIGFGYSGTALALVAPAFFLSKREGWSGLRELILAITAFALAITARFIDSVVGASLLPMGTHWLWHCFGAVSVYFMFQFLIQRYDRAAAESLNV